MKMTSGPFFALALFGIAVTAFGMIMAKTLPMSNNDRAPNDLRQAALHILNPQFHASSVGVEIGSTSQANIEAELALVQRYREWAQTQPTDIRRAYNYWLDHFEGQAHSAQAAINNGAREKWETKQRAERAEYERTSTLARSMPRP